MNIGMMLALLVQAGACAPVPFQGSDGSTLTVLVCPQMHPAQPGKEPDAAPGPEERKL